MTSKVGLPLVAPDVSSVAAYTLSGQTREMGIRMALGSSRLARGYPSSLTALYPPLAWNAR